MAQNPLPPISFPDLPEDIQQNILSFLRPHEITSFASTCRRFASLLRPSSALWLSLCNRRWSSHTKILNWSPFPSPLLYKTLDQWERLIGFWRNIAGGTPALILFEWNPSCITASRISPSPSSPYAVRKIPFLWLGLSPSGDTLSCLHPDHPVTISFIGCKHFVVDENWREELLGSPEDRVVSEIYQYFANRTSPGAERSSRRLRRKKEKERVGGRRRLEAQHFVRISNCCPTAARPLQGLWKVIDWRNYFVHSLHLEKKKFIYLFI